MSAWSSKTKNYLLSMINSDENDLRWPRRNSCWSKSSILRLKTREHLMKSFKLSDLFCNPFSFPPRFPIPAKILISLRQEIGGLPINFKTNDIIKKINACYHLQYSSPKWPYICLNSISFVIVYISFKLFTTIIFRR